MAIVREVPVRLCDEWVQLQISRGQGGRAFQKIPAEEAPCLGAAADLGVDKFLVWRVTDCDKQQCLELEELSGEEGGSSGRLRVFLEEQIVDVKCLVADDEVALLIFTLTSAWFTRAHLSGSEQPLPLLFPCAYRGGAAKECSWADLTDWKQVFDAKEGQSVLCSDARWAQNSDDVEAFLGTNGGTTVMLTISAQGRGSIKSEFRQTSGPGFTSLFRSPAKNVTGGQRVSSVLAEGDDKLLSLSDDGKVKRWNTRSGKCLAEVLLAVKSCICAVKEP